MTEERTEQAMEPVEAGVQSEEVETPAEQPVEAAEDREADGAGADGAPAEVVDASELVSESAPVETDRARLKAVIEAVIYVTDEPLTAQQIAAALNTPLELVRELLDTLSAEYAQPDRGLSIREVAGGYKLGTKPEHHEEVRAFVKNLKPPFKLSLAALETLAVIAYKQPVTGPEIMEIRGVQGLGVLKTLIDRKLIATAGRKNVVGKPILYKTTRDFLVQFGLKDLGELPTLKEFEELGRLALSDGEPEAPAPEAIESKPESEAVAHAESQAVVEDSSPAESSEAAPAGELQKSEDA